ncbi:LOW QUALITY PROTEIN: Pol protein, partial [Phytophthora palmivora]
MPLRLKVNPYEGKEGENLHFWVREVELAMDAARISAERLRVGFAVSHLRGRVKIWAYTHEATMPGCFTTWAQLCQQLRAAFLPANYEYRQRSHFLACKQGKRELHEYIQEMRVLTASLVGNPLPEHIKVTVFMDGLKVDPSRKQLFRVHANTMEEAIQIALQEEYSHRQARTPTSVWQDDNASTGVVQGAPATGTSTGPVPMELGTAVQSSIRCYGYGKFGHMQHAALREGKGSSLPNLGARGARGRSRDPRARGTGVTSRGGTPYYGSSKSPWSADGARHGGLAPGSLGALETRKNSGELLVVHASAVARNGDKYADALRESEGRGQVSVRLADDLAVKFEAFDSTEAFLVMDKYDLILSMPWLEKHEPWIDWRGKAIGLSRPAVSDRALVSNVPTSVRDWGAREGRQGAYAPEEVLGVTDSNEDVAMSLATGRETKAHCRSCGIATTASRNAKSRRAVWASTVAVPGGTDQAGNIGPQVGNIGPQAGNVVPQAGNIGPQAAEAAGEDAECVSNVGNIVPQMGNRNTVPHKVEETKKIESAACVSSVGNVVPRGVKKTSKRAGLTLSTSRADNKAPHSESETPPARPVEEQYQIFDGVSGRQEKAGAVLLEALPDVSALLNLEELSMKDFLAKLKAGEIAEMVLLKPETSPEDLNSSSVMDEDVLDGFTKQRVTRLGSEILKNPEDPVYPLVKEYSDVVVLGCGVKTSFTQLPPDREVRHEIDLVPGTNYCVTKQRPLPREQHEVIDAFFAEKAKSGMVRESKSPHSTPTFCVRKTNGKWRLAHAYNKLNNAT